MNGQRVLLGQLVTTANALEKLTPDDVLLAVQRHMQGDWGEVEQEDWKENDQAVLHGFQVISAYTATNGQKFWIITEGDRTLTTVLLPDDY